MKVGSLIKYYRTKQGMTQSELVEGICSVPHLSKIENNGKEANRQTIDLLLNRLGVNLSIVEEKNSSIKDLLEEWINNINYLQYREAKSVYNQLESLTEFIEHTSYLYIYELYKLRYFLFVEDMKQAYKQYKWLEKQKNNFSFNETYLFHYYHSIYLIMKNKYRQANQLLLDLVLEKSEGINASGDVYYHLALVKCYMEQPGHAIFYAKKALTSFSSQYNIKRILHTLMIMGISYTDSGVYEVAIDCFKHLKRNAKILGEPSLLSLTYHNIGYMKHKMGDLEEARNYFQYALDYSKNDRYSYMVSLYTFAETTFQLGRMEESMEYFKQVKEEAVYLENKIYHLLPNYYLLMIRNEEEKAIHYLQEYTLPFLHNTGRNYTDIRQIYKILAAYYKKIGKFEKSLQYIDID